MVEHKIINRGRGPEIEGTRITVYDIWDYAKEGVHKIEIATYLGLSTREVQVALDYIDEHKDEVLANYAKIMERINRGNPPEIQARLDSAYERMTRYRDEIRMRKQREVIGESAIA